MILNIPTSPIVNSNGQMSQEWLIFMNQLVRKIDEIEKAGKSAPP